MRSKVKVDTFHQNEAHVSDIRHPSPLCRRQRGNAYNAWRHERCESTEHFLSCPYFLSR